MLKRLFVEHKIDRKKPVDYNLGRYLKTPITTGFTRSIAELAADQQYVEIILNDPFPDEEKEKREPLKFKKVQQKFKN